MKTRLSILVCVVLQGWSAFGQPGSETVRVMIGSMVPAIRKNTSKDEVSPVQAIGSGNLAGAIQPAQGPLVLEVYTDSDEQFQVHQMIEEEQKRAGPVNTLSPAIVSTLRVKHKFEYFVFVKYWTVDANNVKIDAALGKLADNNDVRLVTTASVTTQQNAPDFKALGEQLYDALLQEKGKPSRHRFHVTFCDFEWLSGKDDQDVKDFILGSLRSAIIGNLETWRSQSYVRDVSATCSAQPADESIVVHGYIHKLGDSIQFEVRFTFNGVLVATRGRTVNMKSMELGPDAEMLTVAEDLRDQCARWRPPQTSPK